MTRFVYPSNTFVNVTFVFRLMCLAIIVFPLPVEGTINPPKIVYRIPRSLVNGENDAI